MLVNKWQDMPRKAAYALSGMHAACKHFGAIKSAIGRIKREDLGNNRAS
jgi:hypothetical protein